MDTQNIQSIILNKETNKEFVFSSLENGKTLFDSKELNINIEKTEDGFLFLGMADKKYSLEIISCKQNEYELLVNGVSYIFSVETPFSLKRKKMLVSQASESTTIRLKAPMPGKILEVMVKTGDMVKAGDTLLILEAMKMQNAILASTKGIIKKVLVKEGDTTSKSDLLIELEKEI